MNRLILTLTAALFLSGCTRNTGGNKFLDYDKGVINLRLVTAIRTETFVASGANGGREPIVGLSFVHADSFKHSDKSSFDIVFTDAQKADVAFKKIQEFVKSSDTYLKIEL